MTPATDTYVFLRAFVDELARCGMRTACTSPGSRCAPLVLTLAREKRLECHSHIDERCAGFFALGAAKASGLPVAVTCTSGTAVAELLPAAVEAREARVPLLLLSADRPPELRENGAGQAIDQLKIFGDAAKWFFEVGTHNATPERVRWIRTLACRAYWTAIEGRPGAVHLNFPLREPLVTDAALPADETGRPAGRPYVLLTTHMTSTLTLPHTSTLPAAPSQRRGATASASTLGSRAESLAGLRELQAGARRGLLIAGRHERPTPLAGAVTAFAEALGWPVLADPLSGARRGSTAIAHYDALLRDESFAATQRPDLVLRVGDLPVSKPLRTWLASMTDVRQVTLDPEGAWQDPGSVLSDSIAMEPAATLAGLIDAAAASPTVGFPDSSAEPAPAPRGPEPVSLRPADADWLAAWRSADEQAAEAILGVLQGESLDEPSVAAELGVLLPEEATLFVASSMPVRDIETFWPIRADPPRVLCNRGANGIDGTVSSALGAAAASDGPVVLLIGDVALAHDVGGLLAAPRLGQKLTIVLLDNDGGGIFDFLPVSRSAMARNKDGGAEQGTHSDGDIRASEETRTDGSIRIGEHAGADEDIYTRHIATPTGLDFAGLATLCGFAHEPVQTISDFRGALERTLAPRASSTLIHVRTDRAANVTLHVDVWGAVSRAMKGDTDPEIAMPTQKPHVHPQKPHSDPEVAGDE
ncbi:MAG TPA: 2-succinyl-5-enolpyruvyl-6-hydroxy-3-cyclohexene-1-carboxylic-acid synthase [Solirubrobacteraceae bacterium]|jgi:2-succinyl-5-enolpyruvyl-6-hydroxy-3-cyclohexene-1-carboxylate synthase